MRRCYFVKSCLSVSVVTSVSKLKCFELLAVSVCLGKNNTGKILVIGFYCSPSAPVGAIDVLFDLISNYGNSELLILGYMNVNWLTNTSDHLKISAMNSISHSLFLPLLGWIQKMQERPHI